MSNLALARLGHVVATVIALCAIPVLLFLLWFIRDERVHPDRYGALPKDGER